MDERSRRHHFKDIQSCIGGSSGSSPHTPRRARWAPLLPPPPPPPPPATPVDVPAILDKLAGQSKEKLDWRHSIVDMMKLLDLDSSLGARKHLAEELHYTGNMNDSASMNIWLHGQVMTKLAENGGKVPDDLKA